MLPHGNDRIRVAEDGRVILSSRFPKGWEPRIVKTLTTSEHPGTAVLCGEEYYEVVEATAQTHGGVRYVLAKWKDEHAIRVADSYDEQSEAGRVAAHEAAISREKNRKGATATGIFIGHLPAVVQEQLGSELGVLPARLTLLSLLIPLAVIALIVWRAVSQIMSERSPSTPLILLAAYLLVESGFRYLLVMTQARPVGSAAGVAGYLIAYALGPKARMVSPFGAPKGLSTKALGTADDERRLADELLLKEPLVTLLTVPEQMALAVRFGYDYHRQSSRTAIRLLILAIIGIVSSIATLRHTPRISAMAALISAVLLAVEQVTRLNALRRGPVSSVLAVVARPFLGRLLAAGAEPFPESEAEVLEREE